MRKNGGGKGDRLSRRGTFNLPLAKKKGTMGRSKLSVRK